MSGRLGRCFLAVPSRSTGVARVALSQPVGYHLCVADAPVDHGLNSVRRKIHLVRAEITLDTFAVRPATSTAAAHVATGTIRYDVEHIRTLGWSEDMEQNLTGRIVWIKPMLFAADVADVRQYGLENAEFPQQSTVDQWFDESQFESYRRFGELTVDVGFAKGVSVIPPGAGLTVGIVEKIFENV